jgi:hypothetical protein
VLNCNSLVVADSSVRKRLESLLPAVAELTGIVFKWELLKQHELVEEQLSKVYEEHRAKHLPKPLRAEPNGLGFNGTADKLNLIVPEAGRGLLLLHQSQVLLIDPGENIEGMLTYYGIPLSALKAVVLTRATSLNLFQLFFHSMQTTVITTEQVYSDLKRHLKTYFFWDDAMIRQKLKGNIMIEQ